MDIRWISFGNLTPLTPEKILMFSYELVIHLLGNSNHCLALAFGVF